MSEEDRINSADGTTPERAAWPARRKKVRRTREQIAQERQQAQERVNRELDKLAAEYYKDKPREKYTAVGGIYARFSCRFQSSILDQVRALLDAAEKQDIYVPRENIFYDMAIRGFKEERRGLIAIKQAISMKQFEVFLTYSTSRLFRRAYKAQQVVEEEIIDRKLRAIFLASNIDTKQENWRMMFQLLTSLDEATVRTCGASVRTSHEGLFIEGMVCTTLVLGYTGEVVEGAFTKRKLPRRRIIVDREAAKWIEKIYDWYVRDNLTFNVIAQKLNDDPDAPAPAKSLTGFWTARLVRAHLKNPCYRGFWCYGVSETVWSSGKDYAQQVERDAPLKAGHFENLRIVSDERWYAAQEKIAKEFGNRGRKSKDGDTASRPRLVQRLYFCPEHGRCLVVGGFKGRILFCPVCRAIKAESRPLFTHLRRKLAVRLTCEKLDDLVHADDALVEQIITACQQAAAMLQRPDPGNLAKLKADAERLKRTIDYNRRNPGESDEDQARTTQLVKQLESERNSLLAQVTRHEADQARVIVVPSANEVRQLLDQLGKSLQNAAEAKSEQEMRAARQIIDELTGGKIEMYQMGARVKGQGWLQGCFRVSLLNFAIEKLTGVRPVGNEGSIEVVIDFKEPPFLDRQAEEAKKLYDQNLANWQIAKAMGISRSRVTKLVKHAFSQLGEPYPDGRSRRHQLEGNQQKQAVYKEIADEVASLVEAGYSNCEIARQKKVSDATVANAIMWWYTSRGLPVPSAAKRRELALSRAEKMLEEGMELKEIAATLHYSPRGLKLALRKYLAERGKELPDGRSLRGRRSTPPAGEADQHDDAA